ncbi:MAG TPA: hypothetical protein PKC36_14205 [Dietzia sp.]|jgi:hypothetical protein|nr:hypothetical protein [Dietzia sp.]
MRILLPILGWLLTWPFRGGIRRMVIALGVLIVVGVLIAPLMGPMTHAVWLMIITLTLLIIVYRFLLGGR